MQSPLLTAVIEWSSFIWLIIYKGDATTSLSYFRMHKPTYRLRQWMKRSSYTHTTVLYIYTWRGYIEYYPWIHESDTHPWLLVTQKTPQDTSSILSFLSFFPLLSLVVLSRRRRPGGRLPADIKATTKRVDKTTVTLRVCLVKTWAHLFLQGECRSKQRSPLFPCPASKWPTNHSNKRNTRSIVYIYNSWIILASQYVYIPRKFIFMCV